jgi:S1-C subfamily serine protease
VVGLTPRGASHLGAKGGVLVVSVLPGSAAERGGLRAGDVIETAAGKPFTNAELRAILRNSSEPHLDLGVVRGPQKLTVLLPLDGQEEE